MKPIDEEGRIAEIVRFERKSSCRNVPPKVLSRTWTEQFPGIGLFLVQSDSFALKYVSNVFPAVNLSLFTILLLQACR